MSYCHKCFDRCTCIDYKEQKSHYRCPTCAGVFSVIEGDVKMYTANCAHCGELLMVNNGVIFEVYKPKKRGLKQHKLCYK